MPLNPESLTVRRANNIWQIWFYYLPITIFISLTPSILLGLKISEFILDKTYLNFQKWIGALCDPGITSITDATCFQGDYSIQTGIYVFFSFATPVMLMTLIFTFSGLIFCKPLNRGNYQLWLIHENGKTIGELLIGYNSRSQTYSLLSIHIKSKFQNRGYGSHFLRTVLQQRLVPMYVLPVPKALNFYIRLGFRHATIEEFPSRFPSKYLRRLMVYGLDPANEDLESDRP